MNGLLLLLSLNVFNNAEARSHHLEPYHQNPVSFHHQHNAEEYNQLITLIQRWENASWRGAKRAEFMVDADIRELLRHQAIKDRAKINALRADIRDLKQRRNALYSQPRVTARQQRRLVRTENRLERARLDLDALRAHQQQTQDLRQQLRSLQPRFEQGLASRRDYRQKRNLLWRLAEATGQEPLVNVSYTYSVTTWR